MMLCSQYRPVHIAQAELIVDMDEMDVNNLRGRGRRVQEVVYKEEESGRAKTVISNEICAAVIDHLLVRGNTMREVGQRVRPSLRRLP